MATRRARKACAWECTPLVRCTNAWRRASACVLGGGKGGGGIWLWMAWGGCGFFCVGTFTFGYVIAYLGLHSERRGGEQGRQPPFLLPAGRLGGLFVSTGWISLPNDVPSASRHARTSNAMRVGLGPAAFPPPAAAAKGRGGAPAAAAHWCSTSSRGTVFVWDESLCGMSQTLSGCVHSKPKTNNGHTHVPVATPSGCRRRARLPTSGGAQGKVPEGEAETLAPLLLGVGKRDAV